MQAVRAGLRALRSSSSSFPSSRCFNVFSSPISMPDNVGLVLGSIGGIRVFSLSASANSSVLQKEEVASRITNLLKSLPFIDPAKVISTASFEGDLQLDILHNVKVLKAAEEEFAVDIPFNEVYKIPTVAHLIDYIAAKSQAK